MPKNSESQAELSIYDGSLTEKCITEKVVIIKKSFPSLPLSFYDVLIDRIRENGFNDKRLIDAVNHVIDTCIYPTPTIADFISFDRKIKTYTYGQYCDLCDQGDGKNYAPVRLDNMPKPVWIHVNDISKYGLKELIP